jgi:hypothetical protein
VIDPHAETEAYTPADPNTPLPAARPVRRRAESPSRPAGESSGFTLVLVGLVLALSAAIAYLLLTR